ncbi:MAG: PHP domain-containing protein [Candidatus Diapherotrites archaeon]|nr:PHP domain-containing protein [Candidatus Diapherotrites archaeon]
MQLDLHVHSKYSNDGVSSPEEIVKAAAAKGIVVAATDHNNCNAWADYRKAGKKHCVQVVLGEEIKVREQGTLLGEVLALFLNEPVLCNEFNEVVDAVRQQGGLLAAAHPFDILRKPYLRGFSALPRLYKQIDAIEVFNSRTFIGLFNDRARRFAEERKMPKICGSDAHTAGEVGNARTEVKADSLEGAMKEIRKGRTTLHCKRAAFSVRFYSSVKRMGLTR